MEGDRQRRPKVGMDASLTKPIQPKDRFRAIVALMPAALDWLATQTGPALPA
jgi:hypothetical protein